MARVTPAAKIHLGGTTAIYREALILGGGVIGSSLSSLAQRAGFRFGRS